MSPAQLASRMMNTDEYFNRFLTVDPDMIALKNRARRLVHHTDPVLITGPTGVGKEVLARALHKSSEDNPQDFLALNCAGLSETLLESDLFGHLKGSFTDAKTDKTGALLSVGDGTVLMDEVDRMPLSIQSKLLRTIQEMEVRPVGSSKSVPISCRFLFTAKHDLLAKVDRGEFLPDLYGRIMIFHLEITPLINRPSDIDLILTTPETRRDKNNQVIPTGGLGLSPEHLPLPESYLELVKRFNVRALIAYQRRIQVFKSA